jgi:hypothetical protein
MNILITEIEYFRVWKKKSPIIYIAKETLKRLTGSSDLTQFAGCTIKILKNCEYGYFLK